MTSSRGNGKGGKGEEEMGRENGEVICFYARLGWRGRRGRDGLVVLRGSVGVFAHPLNGLVWVEPSIFLSAHFRGEPQEGKDLSCL